MPTIVMSKQAGKLDPSVKKKAYTFLEKLAEDDTVPGLHIEPLHNSADPRARTGRVDQAYRAVLFKITGGGDTIYVFHGIWMHDDAIAIAKKTVLSVNPVNGITEIRTVEPEAQSEPPSPEPQLPPAPAAAPVVRPLLERHGITVAAMVEELGIEPGLAERAAQARDDDELTDLITDAVEWQGFALIELAAGMDLAEVKERFGVAQLAERRDRPTTDETLAEGLRHPAAQLTFAYIEDNAELRRVIEDGDFGAWRVFLHPEQRRYVTKTWNGPFRLSGGAGTGKTVVVLHRAAELARRSPEARVVVTTFTTNLADMLAQHLRELDSKLPFAQHLGEPGIYVAGNDSLARSVLGAAEGELVQDISQVLGTGGGDAPRTTQPAPWRDAIDLSGANLPPGLKSEAFFAAEYGGVVLPNLITSREDYYRVRRPGRGVSLDRTKRAAVWDVVEAARAQSRIQNSWDYPEAAAVAAAHLRRTGEPLADHLLVDEGQDLAPTHWQLLRALVGEHRDDLFIAEDSHQRIYGRRTVLSQFGIRIVGRAQRLTLNYRTTAQNLAYGLGILSGGTYTDLEDQPEESNRYRSARRGPAPELHACASLGAELDQAAEMLQRWLGGTAAPETIAVLVRDRWQRDRVAKGLAERGVTVRAVDRDHVKPGQPLVMTMHRAKGTEFSKVLLFGINTGSVPAALKDEKYADDAWADAMLRERSLLYVAATRARDELAVSWSGAPSKLIGGSGSAMKG